MSCNSFISFPNVVLHVGVGTASQQPLLTVHHHQLSGEQIFLIFTEKPHISHLTSHLSTIPAQCGPCGPVVKAGTETPLQDLTG